MSSAVGGAQPSHNPSDSISGRNPTIPAIPSVNGNGAFQGEHSRKPSATVTPAGTTGFNNGSSQNKNNIQFGAINAGGSESAGSPATQPAHQTSTSLGVNQLQPRGASPSNSPSPIPQPRVMSGGPTPTTFQGQGNGVVFGQHPSDQNDPSVCNFHFYPIHY